MKTEKGFDNSAYQAKLKKLQQLIIDRFEDIVDEFDMDVQETHNLWIGRCPIHEGADNPTAFNFYKEGDDTPGYFVCNTRQCQNLFHNGKRVFVANPIGLVRALLSVRECGWSEPGDETYGFKDTTNFLQSFFKINIQNYKIDYEDLMQQKLLKESSHYAVQSQTKSTIRYTTDEVKEKLEIPSPYFVKRGFAKETLKRYNIGECYKKNSPLYNRAVCPILDEQGRDVIGFTGRTIYPECEKCKNYHRKQDECGIADVPKWWNVGNFRKSNLYNYSFAQSYIKKSRVVLVVEGQGDVLKLVEHKIYNCVGVFGVSLSDQQQVLLEKAGAMAIIPLFDNPVIDKAGEIAYKQFAEKCAGIFKIYTIKDIYGDKKDVGEFDDEQINKLKQFIEKVERIYR